MGKLIFYAILAWVGYTVYQSIFGKRSIKPSQSEKTTLRKKNEIVDAEFSDIKDDT